MTYTVRSPNQLSLSHTLDSLTKQNERIIHNEN